MNAGSLRVENLGYYLCWANEQVASALDFDRVERT